MVENVHKLWCYNDVHNWGSMLAKAAAARGHDAHLFEDPREPDRGFVFMHMHYHPQVRELHKRCMRVMSTNPDLTLIPNYRSSVLYDDKAEQARQLAKYMPRTHIYWTPSAARRWLDTQPEIPFMSKASEGARSHNVRLVSNYEDAREEIKLAFSDLGIKCRYGQTQRGYLLWQDYIPDNDGDIRVIAIGSQRLVLRRGNHIDRSANKTGRLTPIVKLDDPEIVEALKVADTFFRAENMQWSGIDMVRDTNGRWYILETTVSWTMNAFYECGFMKNGGAMGWNTTGVMGDKIWHVLLDEIEGGAF